MISRLSAVDLPRRLEHWAPARVVQVAAGVLLASFAIAVRAAISIEAPSVPFALVFPAILVATGLAGWEAGLVAVLTGGLLGWYFLLAPRLSFHLATGEAASLVIYLVAGAMVVAAAAAYRATALALRASQERLDLAASAAKVGVWEWPLDADEIFYSDEARRIFGFPPGRPVTYAIAQALTHPEDRLIAQSSRGLRPADEPASFEYRILRNGEVRWLHIMCRAVFEPTKHGCIVTRHVGTVQDITERKADEERLRLLAREVDHRANNLLAVVQGAVALSEAEDPAALKSVITGRVNALARAHQLLAQARWEGADLRRLVEEELLAFSLGDGGRTCVSGPNVALAPAAAQAVAMAVHELATNAAKYGALSVPMGRVEVLWRLDVEGALTLCWSESGGPPVKKPTRKGLGTALLARALSGPIGGQTSLDWRPSGLFCELALPAAALEAQAVHADPSDMRARLEPKSHSAR